MENTKRHLIAVVDDEPNIIKALNRQLIETYEIAGFNSADELMEALDEIRPSLIIIDWLMPVKDGITLCREIREQHRFDLIPIAFHTSLEPSTANMKESFDAGAQSFIPKGSSHTFMMIHLRTLIEQHERMMEYINQKKTMLSVLKHDMSNLLTGVTTGLDVLQMHPAFKDKELREEASLITDAGNDLRVLFQDLSEVLAENTIDDPDKFDDQTFEGINSDIQTYMKNLNRSTELKIPDIEGLRCSRHSLGRSIYYMVRFMDRYLPQGNLIKVMTERNDREVRFRITAEGRYKQTLEDAITHLESSGEGGARYDLLFVQYFQGFLYRSKTGLSIRENEGETEMLFILPLKPAAEQLVNCSASRSDVSSGHSAGNLNPNL